jgi:hypothetical protein
MTGSVPLLTLKIKGKTNSEGLDSIWVYLPTVFKLLGLPYLKCEKWTESVPICVY